MRPTLTSLAFPNAYIETDEIPSHVLREKALALVGLAGLAYFGMTVLVLHFEPTGYNPVTQAVSDYAVGPFGYLMSAGFFLGGVGVVALGFALALRRSLRRMFRLGSFMFVVAGLALISVAFFPTDLEGAASTLHGTLHSLLSQIVFSFGPIGMLLVSYTRGRRWFVLTLSLYAATGAYLSANLALSLGAGGLAERLFILFLFGWWFIVSYRSFKYPSP